MPTHIHHNGIDAQAARLDDQRVWLVRRDGADLGIARELSRNDWMFWRTIEGMRRGDKACWWHGDKLETVLSLVAFEIAA